MINIGDFYQPIMASLAFSISIGFPKLVGGNKQNFDIVKFAQPFVVGILLGIIAGIQNVSVTQDWIASQTAVYFVEIAAIMFVIKMVWRIINEYVFSGLKKAQTALGITDAQVQNAEKIVDDIAIPVEQAILSEQDGVKAVQVGTEAAKSAVIDETIKQIIK